MPQGSRNGRLSFGFPAMLNLEFSGKLVAGVLLILSHGRWKYFEEHVGATKGGNEGSDGRVTGCPFRAEL